MKKILILSTILIVLSCYNKNSKDVDVSSINIYSNEFFNEPLLEKTLSIYMKKENININKVLPSDDEYKSKLKVGFLSDVKPDIFLINSNGALKEFSYYAQTLNNEIDLAKVEQRYIKGIQSQENNITAVPLNSVMYGVFYNKRIFNEMGINPDNIKTIQDLEDAVSEIHKNKKDLDLLSAVSSSLGVKKEVANYQSSMFIYPEMVNKKDNLDFNFTYNLGFKKIIDIQKKYSPYKDIKKTKPQDKQLELFIEQKTAVIITGSWIYKYFNFTKDNDDSSKNTSIKVDDVGFLPIPYDEQGPGEHKKYIMAGPMYYFAINKDIPLQKKQKVDNFLTWLINSYQFQETITKIGYLPIIDLNEKKELFTYNKFYQDYLDYKQKGQIIEFYHQKYPMYWSENILYPLINEYLIDEIDWEELVKIAIIRWKKDSDS